MNTLIKRILILCMVFVSTIAVAFGFLQDGGTQDNQLPEGLRIQVIQQLIDKQFDKFVTMPFGPGNDNVHLTGSMTYPEFPEYYMNTGLNVQDDLDILLEKKIEALYSERSLYAKLLNLPIDPVVLDDKDIAELSTVYLFKNQQDLEDLGYVVSSYRTRVNTDAAWRKDNIAISYRNIGNVRVINPQQQLSFMDEIHYDASANDWKRDTVSGLAIMGGVTSVKGGGICGASRGINATIITNKAFDIVTRYNHSKTWKHLYQNVINGQEIWLPGMDVAVYRMGGSQKDFVFKNIREYPVVLVMNYDGTSGGTEELFVLSHEEDRGTLQYIGRKGNCFSWEANGEAFRSCYNSVSGR